MEVPGPFFSRQAGGDREPTLPGSHVASHFLAEATGARRTRRVTIVPSLFHPTDRLVIANCAFIQVSLPARKRATRDVIVRRGPNHNRRPH